MSGSRRNEIARADRVQPGVWRLRLPLPWPGVPHGNAFAVAHEGGIVLFDTGMATDDGLRQLELALAQAGWRLADVRLVVCTHAHADHYGLAGPILDAAGCELWMHPRWEHVRAYAENPEAALERRVEVARQSGVPMEVLAGYQEARRNTGTGIALVVEPDRELVPGVEVLSDLGAWQVHETPGHAPSHVVLHQPEEGFLVSGDHLLGRVSIFFDYGHTPDPVAEFTTSLGVVEELDTRLCLAGHGRPFRDVQAKVAANRDQLDEHLGAIRGEIADGERTPFEVAAPLLGTDTVNPAMAPWALQLALAYLDHLVLAGEAEVESDGDGVRRWRAA
ncbi:MAG TPA: MBL fold metallo-hydrolase [Solirubrobacterales bacterium]|nr:MBL fold metallo-hydrolase [Solirubrobacterales bacterium]